MQIVELVNSLEVGGTERLVVSLSKAMKRRGHVLTVVCLRGGGPLQSDLDREEIEVVALNKAEGPSLQTLTRLMALLRAKGADVVHSHNPLVHHYAVAAGRASRVPVIVNTIHGIGNVSPTLGLKERLYRLSCQASSGVVAVSATARRVLAKNPAIPAGKLITIKNGVPLDGFLSVAPRPDDGRVVFGIVGRLVAVKDHATLLRAFASASLQRGDLLLEILGDGPEREALENLAETLGIGHKVVFHGYHDDVAGFLSRIDVAVLSSLSEGLPLSLVEAMAAAKPILSTAVGGVPDLIVDGDCGWTCAPADPKRMANALSTAAATPRAIRHALGLCGRERAVREYSLNQMAAEYERAFISMADRPAETAAV
ncbi:MAG: glycosyltransferase [Steroidobacteraceae bacterium]|jgi:glycosyltransferase involved in cell wall biosynthesis|nr:glycosyltransferase [Steroidobacteraceae bacterium]